MQWNKLVAKLGAIIIFTPGLHITLLTAKKE